MTSTTLAAQRALIYLLVESDIADVSALMISFWEGISTVFLRFPSPSKKGEHAAFNTCSQGALGNGAYPMWFDERAREKKMRLCTCLCAPNLQNKV